jgi:membrane associated rhomboid family serine protease
MVRPAMEHLGRALSLPLLAVGLMWALELVDWALPGAPLDQLGIRPRVPSGLWGIALAPWLHLGFAHLAANSVPLLALGALVALRRPVDFLAVGLLCALVAGLGTWLFGAPGTLHLGASGVVFGLLAFLLTRALFERSPGAILLSLIAAALYGGLVWRLLPVQAGISWSGHLFGFCGGLLAAWLLPVRRGERAKADRRR